MRYSIRRSILAVLLLATLGWVASSGHAHAATTYTQVSAGIIHTCAVQTGGTVVCWGDKGGGKATPPSGSFKQVSAGTNHTCGVQTGGSVVCWGSTAAAGLPSFGQETPPSGSFTQVSAGFAHTCAVQTGGTVVCWGSIGGRTPPSGSFTQVSVGGDHTCGVQTGGSVVCWAAYNFYGEATPPAAASLSSPTATSVTATTATVGGTVTSAGSAAVTERGVVYAATATNPTPQIGGTGVTKVAATAAGTGTFTVSASGLTPGTGYSYAVYATNSVGISYTTPATFSTSAAPVVTTNPVSKTALRPYDSVFFLAFASGTPTPTIQWQQSTDGGVTFTDIPGETLQSYSFLALVTMDQWRFRAVFTNSLGTATTTAATLTVRQAPLITSASATTFTVGSAGSFTVTAQGNPPPTLSVTGALPSGVSFNPTAGVLSGTPAAGTAGTYPLTFRAMNGAGESYTQSFTLTVSSAPTPTPTVTVVPPTSVAAGGQVQTNTTATSTDPVGTTVTTPTAGSVSIAEKATLEPSTDPSASAYTFFGQQVEITAPAGSTTAPLRLQFSIDASLIVAPANETTVGVFRNGVLVPECATAGTLGPDPCVSGRVKLTSGDSAGDVQLTILTSAASRWNFGTRVADTTRPVVTVPAAQTCLLYTSPSPRDS